MDHKIKILWFEDQPEEWRYIKDILKESEYELTLAEDVEQFFSYQDKFEEFDLLIIDLIIWVSIDKQYQLEKYFGKKSIASIMVGLEVLRKLCDMKINTPIMVLTVVNEASDNGKAIFNEIKKLEFPKGIKIISKSLSLSEIEETIKEMVNR